MGRFEVPPPNFMGPSGIEKAVWCYASAEWGLRDNHHDTGQHAKNNRQQDFTETRLAH